MKKLLLALLSLFTTTLLFTQNPNKKTLGHEELVSWNRVQDRQISNDGNWVCYSLSPEEGNKTMKVWNAETGQTVGFERSSGARFTSDNRFLVFKIKADWDTIRTLKREKVKKDKMPKDTLGIYNLETGGLEKIANVKSFKLPQKWDGWLVYHKEVEKAKKDTASVAVDTTQMAQPDSVKMAKKKKKKKSKAKKENKKNGTKLVIRELESEEETIVDFVKDYALSEEGGRIAITSTGKDSTFLEGVYLYDCEKKELKPLFQQKGVYKNLIFDERGNQLVFHLNLDTTEARIAPFGIAYWTNRMESAAVVIDSLSSILPEDWIISEHGRPSFSQDGSKMYFGIAPPPVLKDTSLLEEEVVSVEVWHYEDAVLHTQQKNRLNQDKKRNYRAVWHIIENKLVQLGSEEMPTIRTGDEGNSYYALGYNQMPYWKMVSWESFPQRRDAYVINTRSGRETLIGKNIKGSTALSPDAQYVYWYSYPDSAWVTYNIDEETTATVTNNKSVKFYRETHDSPSLPGANGMAGWTEDDEFMLIYDRYDIWKIDPDGRKDPERLTNGRVNQIRYRNIWLDRERRNIDLSQPMLLSIFDEKTKGSGYASLNPENGQITEMVFDKNLRYDSRPTKARDVDKLLFTKENFEIFPDLWHASLDLSGSKRVSYANPQQKDYSWGTMELYEWTDLNGNVLQGMLVKPENFDPSKKYPMLVNFYEKSSDGMHRHRTPLPGRSTINYPFYVSKGYVIFNPDVPYRIGYPGESALNAVLSGVTSLIDKGFIDRKKIGVQGHSWGGYQVAYLVNKTDIFACAESGAPVVNMFSAYGGIRWGSGLSRMFQYEQTQSRIGGTIWEYPLRYLENSPLFTLDKCNTPVLILHNDKDGAVPWYQGIEYFVGLRRLGKPAWMLNYNNEPHWPVKLQNRKDFNVRMQQFFDYYLMDQPMPKWMEKGVPAIEKGILQGLETNE